jgi:hypothetical protein
MKMITNVNEVKLTEEEYDVFIGLLYEDRTTLDKIIGFITDPENNDKPAKRTYLPVDSETKEMCLTSAPMAPINRI